MVSATLAPASRAIPREPRVRVNRELESLFPGIREYATDVSRSGALFRSRRTPPVGSRVELAFSVIIDEIETIRGVGEVVRNEERPRGYGVRFLDLDSVSRDVLARLLARASERGEAFA